MGIGGWHEEQTALALARMGCAVWRRGWPDFLAVHDDFGTFCVEAKEGADRPTLDQALVGYALNRAGVRTLVVRPENLSTFEAFGPGAYPDAILEGHRADYKAAKKEWLEISQRERRWTARKGALLQRVERLQADLAIESSPWLGMMLGRTRNQPPTG